MASHAPCRSPRFIYSEVFDGFAADLTPGQVNALRRNGSVRGVEVDRVATVVPLGKPTKPGGGGSTEPTPQPDPVDGTQELPADGSLWGLDRIDAAGLDQLYSYATTGTGTGVTAYVVDTGISTAHPDFGGRATLAFDNAGGKPARGGDCNGHGTHVAGTIGGTTHGVAKRVQLRSVRVLDCNGSGAYSGVIAGLDHVLKNHPGPRWST
ncbi:S8 family serine peptidase [Blastococcus brunescens]|uniref:S8 family serine peptidase n=1 Tax=Blastococcus brunescens TaxID=1564165 RepID=A0ABZ1AUG1_9ACTN|nr:S8 family serine peptidase [Blastococcus sp. BMG 8361]WRL62218.1 S8 family serine peptidase [Blastococcus sp. BMG 8361]